MIAGNSIVGYKYYMLHSRRLIQLRDSCGRTVLVASTLKSVDETLLGHKLLTSFCSLKLKLTLQGLGNEKLFCALWPFVTSGVIQCLTGWLWKGLDRCRIKLLHGTVLATLNSWRFRNEETGTSYVSQRLLGLLLGTGKKLANRWVARA